MPGKRERKSRVGKLQARWQIQTETETEYVENPVPRMECLCFIHELQIYRVRYSRYT